MKHDVMTKREILFQIEIAINDACTNSNCEWLGYAGVEQESRNAYETVIGLINEIKLDSTCSTCKHMKHGDESMDDMAFFNTNDTLVDAWQSIVEMNSFGCNLWEKQDD